MFLCFLLIELKLFKLGMVIAPSLPTDFASEILISIFYVETALEPSMGRVADADSEP